MNERGEITTNAEEIQAFFKKQESSQIYNLTLHLKELEKEQQIKLNPAGEEN